MSHRDDSTKPRSPWDLLAANVEAGAVLGALSGVVQFLVFRATDVYLTESFGAQLRSLIQIVALSSLLFAGAGLVLGALSAAMAALGRGGRFDSLLCSGPAATWAFGAAAIPTMWFLAWFNFSYRRQRDLTLVVLDAAFILLFVLLSLALHAALVSVLSHRVARVRPHRTAVVLALAAVTFAMASTSLFGALRLGPEPEPLRKPLPQALHDRAREALADDRYNVLLVTIDALRADHLGCYGYPRNTSPTIDSLAAGGALFLNAVVQYPMTSPNFATLMTGTYPATHGVRRVQTVLPDESVTLAEVLQAAGYATCAVITNGNLYPVFNFSQGFDKYFRCGHKQPERVTNTSLEWLASGPSQPFFLWIHYTEPHGPYQPGPPYDSMYDPQKNPTAPTSGPEAKQERVAEAIARYDGSIRRTDDNLRRLFAGLRELDYAGRTLVILTTDHGESFGEHGYYFGHGAYAYEATVRAALILSLPGIVPAGSRVDATVQTVDIMPTVLDVAGLPLGDRIQGHSFLPTALGLTDAGPGEFGFVQAGVVRHGAKGFVSAIRSGELKYIRRHREWGIFPRDPVNWLLSLTSFFEGGLSCDELYDLSDRRELDNIVRADLERSIQLRRKVDAFLSYLARSQRAPATHLSDPSKLDKETYEALRSLGYIR